MTYAIVNPNTLIVSNIILWDGVSEYAPDGTAIQSDIAQIGDKYENNKFYRFNEETQEWVELV